MCVQQNQSIGRGIIHPHQPQGRQVLAFLMESDHFFQGNVGQDIAVQNKNRRPLHELLTILDGTRGAKGLGFQSVIDLYL